jgi:hypothetical protein
MLQNKNYSYFCGVEFKDKANGREERQKEDRGGLHKGESYDSRDAA